MNGKQKGSEFERQICKKLSLWVTDGKRTDVFWRTAMSGGRATVANAKGESVRQLGDITAVAPEGHALSNPLVLECKFYKTLDIASFIIAGKGKLATFWRQTARLAYKHGRQPWLIAKENHTPALLVTLLIDDTIKRIAPKNPGWAEAQPRCKMQIDNNPCQIWLLDDLLRLTWRRK